MIRPPETDVRSTVQGIPLQRFVSEFLKDAAFQFYYPENLDALIDEGAELVEINAMTAEKLPELDGLYIGGGFPETGARTAG